MSKCKVNVCFYHARHPLYHLRKNRFLKIMEIFLVKLMVFLMKSKWTHCSIELDDGASKSMLVFLVGQRATFARSDTVNGWLGNPNEIVCLGKRDVNIEAIDRIIFAGYRGYRRHVILWFFVTRWLGLKWKPNTCTTLTCKIIQLCNYPIPIYVQPPELYKRLKL